MSPILVRPVREQLEHDRVIRLLLVKLKRRHDVTANIGEDQSAAVKIGLLQIFPDLLLTSTDRGHRLMGTVEVETSESVNHLEARAQWAHLGKARAPFHLYVPAGSVDSARRLATENQVNVAEIWSYHTVGDQTRFTLVHRSQAETRRAANAAARSTASVARPAATANPLAEKAVAAKPAALKPIAGKATSAKPGVVTPARPEKKAAAARTATSARTAASARPAKKRGAPEPRRGASSSRAAAPARKPASAQNQKRK